jgi:hypothetical protein
MTGFPDLRATSRTHGRRIGPARVDHEEDGIRLFDGRFGLSRMRPDRLSGADCSSPAVSITAKRVAESAFPLAPVAGDAGLL